MFPAISAKSAVLEKSPLNVLPYMGMTATLIFFRDCFS